LPEITLRRIGHGDEAALLGILNQTFGDLQDLQRTKNVLSSHSFNPDGCFIADDNGSAIGCVAVTSLPRKNWLVIRYLAVKRAASRIEVAKKLLSRAIEYAESKHFEFLRSTTPAIQPYVDVYKGLGFKPIRRDFRITWDLRELLESARKPIDTREVTDETIEEASEVFVQSLHPYWDSRTEEQGGSEAVSRSFKEGVDRGEKWRLVVSGGHVVGLVGLISDYYTTSEARFRGAYVVPEHRSKGLGMAIMLQALNWARKLGQKKMTVYTFSYLDCLAPGALLYLKSGGKIESEYLQLQSHNKPSIQTTGLKV